MLRKISIALLAIAASISFITPVHAEGFVESITKQTSGADLPHASDGYQPAKTLAFSQGRVVQAVVDVFDENRIPVNTMDKKDGRITSDYVQGPTYVTAFGLLGSNSTRYKFAVSTPDSGKHAVRLKIVATLESSGNELQTWRDVSADNKEAVTALENWLHEKVENELKGK